MIVARSIDRPSFRHLFINTLSFARLLLLSVPKPSVVAYHTGNCGQERFIHVNIEYVFSINRNERGKYFDTHSSSAFYHGIFSSYKMSFSTIPILLPYSLSHLKLLLSTFYLLSSINRSSWKPTRFGDRSHLEEGTFPSYHVRSEAKKRSKKFAGDSFHRALNPRDKISRKKTRRLFFGFSKWLAVVGRRDEAPRHNYSRSK